MFALKRSSSLFSTLYISSASSYAPTAAIGSSLITGSLYNSQSTSTTTTYNNIFRSYCSTTTTASLEATTQSNNIENTIPKKKKIKQYKLNTVSPLKYPIVNTITNINTVKALGGTENLPFHFERTDSGRLGVYSDIIRSRNCQETVVRKFSGNADEIISEIKNIIGQDVDIQQRESSIVIKGNYTQPIVLWLVALGF
ncbi:hypothetical protein DFA_04823 [Cavenderia fasciculata]|uniref:Large ribosomal subunit protein mL49 n=1 Tax=Cavenderia fasciculata TaxID=261658 RepID=F4PLT7_CACFS|nr:uncharacterized protein DFA_04823 [Cavenderia fasciculata]EGG22693.1 hypothetical protein DFA_04823 [Cavenderia fasciculata]|eukprot:XP_004360544.1 hypothetical protein DFA_04823 [Cavenderia fasciculata]